MFGVTFSLDSSGQKAIFSTQLILVPKPLKATAKTLISMDSDPLRLAFHLVFCPFFLSDLLSGPCLVLCPFSWFLPFSAAICKRTLLPATAHLALIKSPSVLNPVPMGCFWVYFPEKNFLKRSNGLSALASAELRSCSYSSRSFSLIRFGISTLISTNSSPALLPYGTPLPLRRNC